MNEPIVARSNYPQEMKEREGGWKGGDAEKRKRGSRKRK